MWLGCGWVYDRLLGASFAKGLARGLCDVPCTFCRPPMHVLMIKHQGSPSGSNQLTVVTNWFEELRGLGD